MKAFFSTLRLVILDYNTVLLQYFMLYSNCNKQPQLGCVNTSRVQRPLTVSSLTKWMGMIQQTK